MRHLAVLGRVVGIAALVFAMFLYSRCGVAHGLSPFAARSTVPALSAFIPTTQVLNEKGEKVPLPKK